MTDKKNIPKAPELDPEIASKMLSNVFEACEVEPNSMPLTVLTSYSNYRKERFLLQKIVLVIIILIFCMVPLLFVTPTLNITKTTTANDQLGYNVSVDSLLPVASITATLGGRDVPVYEIAKKTYSIEPTTNGLLKLKVTLENRQVKEESFRVTAIDITAPTLVSSKSDEDTIYLYLSDTGSGIDYTKVIAKDIAGNDVAPISYDEAASCILFEALPASASLNVYIPDKSGNDLHIILSGN